MDVYDWARRTDVGVRVVYARRPCEAGARPNNLVSAFRAHTEGLVFLAQRRSFDRKSLVEVFLYEATRISSPTAKLLKLGEYA